MVQKQKSGHHTVSGKYQRSTFPFEAKHNHLPMQSTTILQISLQLAPNEKMPIKQRSSLLLALSIESCSKQDHLLHVSNIL